MAVCAKLTGIDLTILQECDESDWKSVFAMGELLLLQFIYESLVFAGMAHLLFAAPGEIRPELIAAALFLGWMIITIDSWQFFRSAWYGAGIRSLKIGGFAIPGGLSARIMASVALLFRLVLSLSLCQLTAILFGMIVFGSTITARLYDQWSKANRDLIAQATTLYDANIHRISADVAAASANVASLSAQVTALRQNEIDSSTDPRIQQTQQELLQLIGQKAKIDEELRNAERFSAAELAGVVAAPGNSGKKGDGPRRKAAIEQVNNLRTHAQEISKSLDAARARQDSLREQGAPADDAAKKRANDQLASFEQAFEADKANLEKLKSDLATATNDRETSIRRAVEQAPNAVPFEVGLLTRIRELERISQESTKVMLVIILIDICSFGFEMAAVLSKLLGNVPFEYATRYAAKVYMRRIQIAEQMADEIQAIDDERRRKNDHRGHEDGPNNPGAPGLAPDLRDLGETKGSTAQQIKRGRGRPRKYPLPATNGTGSEPQGGEPGR